MQENIIFPGDWKQLELPFNWENNDQKDEMQKSAS